MKNLYLVKRNKGDVIVTIMINRIDNKYHFINLTNEHICQCGFNSIEEALLDLEKYKKDGRIIDFYKLP